jgi:demethylmenaquinone methyltransferase/2-methoxy-6-polyprenyl-1,4-benzoquinol methylase
MYAHDAVQPRYDGSSKRDRVARMFDRIASRYDLLNRVISLGLDKGWRRVLVREVASRHPAGRLLDVATGTGDLALALAGAGASEVIGVDISPGMLAEARRKSDAPAPAKAASAVRFELGDAAALPFPDARFDAVTVAFGVRNFEDLEAGLRELSRVLRPGGTLAVLELGTPRSRLLRLGHAAYTRGILPLVAGLVSGERAAYTYLPASVAAFPDPTRFASLLETLGLADVRTRAFALGAAHLTLARRT